jgi:hypothetical protein
VAEPIQMYPLHILIEMVVSRILRRSLRNEILPKFCPALVNGDGMANDIRGHGGRVWKARAFHPRCFELWYAAVLDSLSTGTTERLERLTDLLTQSKSPTKRMGSTGLEKVSRNCSIYLNVSFFSSFSFSDDSVRICQREKVFQANRSISSLPVLSSPM